MKKLLLSLIIILQFVNGLTQDSIPPNRFDSIGLKQGYWLELEAKPILISIRHIQLADTCLEKEIYNFDEHYVLKCYGHYKNGYREGQWKYFLDGKLRSMLTFRSGIIKGEFEKYYENGNLRQSGMVSEDYESEVINYDEQGNITSRSLWITEELLKRLYSW